MEWDRLEEKGATGEARWPREMLAEAMERQLSV